MFTSNTNTYFAYCMLLLFSLTVFAQQSDTTAIDPKDKVFFKPKWEITTAPFSFLSTRPKLKLGFDYYFKKPVILGAEVGYGPDFINHAFLETAWEDGYELIYFSPEVKFILANNCKNCDAYVGVAFLYTDLRANMYDEYYTQIDLPIDRVIRFDSANFRQLRLGGLVKVGGKFYIAQKVLIDFYGGAGAIHLNQSYDNLINPHLSIYNYEKGLIEDIYRQFTKRVLPSLNIGLKVGFLQI